MREIVEKLCKIEAEQARRRQTDYLAAYNGGEVKHEKQLAFHKCLQRNRWVFGGNRSGKTECGAVECVYMARGIHPYRQNRKDVCGWVVSLSTQVQRDVAQKKILHYLRKDWIEDIVMLSGRKDSPEHGIIDFIRVKNVLGGCSIIGFKSCDQGREKFQGASLDFVWFDEEPPEDIYHECKMRLLDRRGEMFGTMTPLKGLTFVYNEIFLKYFEKGEYLLSGKYLWLASGRLIHFTDIEQEINFTYTPKNSTSTKGTKIIVIEQLSEPGVIKNVIRYDTYYQPAISWETDPHTEWIYNVEREIDFGAESQTVSKEFFEWFTKCAEKQVA